MTRYTTILSREEKKARIKAGPTRPEIERAAMHVTSLTTQLANAKARLARLTEQYEK